MLKTNYDDLSSMREGNTKPRRKLSAGVIAVICLLTLIIIAVAILIIYNLLSNVELEEMQSEAPVVAEETEQDIQTPVVPETIASPADAPAASAQAPDFSQSTSASSLAHAAKPVSYDDAVQYHDYVMQPGETLESVAAKNNITIQTLISINQIKNLSAAMEGTKLRIPDRNGRLYTVEEGDMLSSITKKFNLSMGWKTLQEINNLKAETIFVGQQIFIPDETTVQSISHAASGIDFKSPLRGGKTTGYYGQSVVDPVSKSTIYLEGVLIGASDGAVVAASSSGTVMDVAYSTGNMAGFFVRISHDGGYSSYYYFLDQDSIKVSVSDKVDPGDPLGIVSASSSPFGTPVLYFKIEQNGIMLDPNQWFEN